MKITHLFTVGVLAVFLAACNKEAGVSAESAQNTGFKGEFSRSDSKSESAATTHKVIDRQPLLTGIVMAAQDANTYLSDNYYIEWANKDAARYQAGVDYQKKLDQQIYDWMNGQAIHFGAGPHPFDGSIFQDKAGLLADSKSMKLPTQYEEWAKPMDDVIDRFVKGDTQAGADFLLRNEAIQMFIHGVSPSRGWIKYDGLNDDQSTMLYINREERWINFSNLFADELAKTMPQSFKNPSDMRHDFLEAVYKIPDADYYAMFKQADAEAAKVSDITVGQNNPNWAGGIYQYDGQPGGWIYRVGGQTVFGQGYINGQLYEVEVASSLEVSNKKERTDRESQSFGTDQSDKSTVGVK